MNPRHLEEAKSDAENALRGELEKLQKMQADLKTAVEAIQATFNEERKVTKTNSELRVQIADKIMDTNVQFDGITLLLLIDKFMEADDNLTNHKKSLQSFQYREDGTSHFDGIKMIARHNEPQQYPQQPGHLQQQDQYGFRNPEPSERALSQNREMNADGKNDIERKMGGINLYEFSSGGNRIGALYQEDFDKKSSSSNIENHLKSQSTDIYQRDSMPSSTHSTEEKYQERSSSERARTMACNFHKTKPAEEEITSEESSYWEQSRKVKKNRFYVMPIKDTADLKILQTVNGLGAQFAHEELFNRDAQLPPQSIGKRYLFFTPENRLMTQIDLYADGVGQIIVKQAGQSTMFTNQRSISEIQAHRNGEKEISKKEFDRAKKKLTRTRQPVTNYC